MKINNISNFAFQKTLKANCTILKDNKPCQCSIYKLDKGVDDDYIDTKIFPNPAWDFSEYIMGLYLRMEDAIDGLDNVYVMEDKDENCIGYISESIVNNNSNTIEYLEALPKDGKNPKMKYIGETLVNFVLNLTKKRGQNFLFVPVPVQQALGFYNKLGFISSRQGLVMVTESPRARDLNKQNEMHTNSKIEYIG